MYVIRSYGLVHLQGPKMFLSLIFSCSEQFFISPCLCILKLRWGGWNTCWWRLSQQKVVISAFSISCVTSLLFWRVCTYKSFTCCSWCQSSLILWGLYLSWPDPNMLGQYLCVPPWLLALASTLDTLPFCCLVWPEDHCSSLLPSWYFCLTSSLSLE